jgi:hypothetical protein
LASVNVDVILVVAIVRSWKTEVVGGSAPATAARQRRASAAAAAVSDRFDICFLVVWLGPRSPGCIERAVAASQRASAR